MRSQEVPWEWFCLGGAMITSNGWLDVLLYAMTRNLGLFEDDDGSKPRHGLDTFNVPWEDKNTALFGNTTTIIANNAPSIETAPRYRIASFLSGWSHTHGRGDSSSRLPSRDASTNASRETLPYMTTTKDRSKHASVKVTATTSVHSAPATRLELELGEMLARGETKSRDTDSAFDRDDWENRSNDSKRLSRELYSFIDDDNTVFQSHNMKL